MEKTFTYKNIQITYLGHASFLVNHNDYLIYIDPFQLVSGEAANLILVTHTHHDHYDPESITKIINPETKIFAPKLVTDKNEFPNLQPITFPQTIKINNISITSFPAYNINKFRAPNLPYHPKDDGVGYIIKINNTRIFHAGDTDAIPEFSKLKDIDIALLPIGGTYTMTAEEAVDAVKSIKPKYVIPMHYNSLPQLGQTEINKFENLIQKYSKVIIL